MHPDLLAQAAFTSPMVDLRQYTLYPGTRDRFVELMIDSSDVLMLEPLDAGSAFRLAPPSQRPALAAPVPDAMVLASIHHVRAADTPSFAAFYRAQALPQLLRLSPTSRSQLR